MCFSFQWPLCYRKVKLIRKLKNISEYMHKLGAMNSDVKGILQQFSVRLLSTTSAAYGITIDNDFSTVPCSEKFED